MTARSDDPRDPRDERPRDAAPGTPRDAAHDAPSDAAHDAPSDAAHDDALPAELAALLGDAWRQSATPDPTPSLPASDAATRATVRWMRASWEQLEAPAAAPPAALGRALRRRAASGRAPVLAWRRHAAAAALLLTLAAALRLGVDWGAGWSHAPARDATPDAPVTADDTQPARASGARVVAAAPGRLELRAGPVRLLLLDPTDSPPLPNAPSPGSDQR